MKRNLLFLIVAISVFTFGCSKPQGCTDKNATNYSPDAEKDDGTCTYQGEIVFWYDQSTSAFLVNDNATSLTFYVDGSIVGSTATNVYWASAPSCGQNGSITVTKNLGLVKSKSYSYSVVDDTGYTYWQGSISFDAHTCTSHKLVP